MKKVFFIMVIGLISVISPISSFGQNKAKKGDKQQAAAETKSEELNVVKPTLKDGGDSIAYIFGAMQSNGLKDYLVKQLNVDTAYIEDFCKGVLARVAIDSSNKKEMAYQAGLNIGGQVENMCKNLTKDYYEAEPTKQIDSKIVANSLVASLLGKNEYKAQDAAEQFNKTLEAKKAQNTEVLYGPNRIAGEKWLEENKKNDGVITLPSGLQYKVITKGTGDVAKATDKVTVNYEGRLIDGTVFDSSYKRSKPSTFQCNQVIKGWTEALTMMPAGSKWELYIPYNLAYGERNTGNIKPYSALIFTVELISVERAAVKAATTKAGTSTGSQAKAATSPVVRKKTSK